MAGRKRNGLARLLAAVEYAPGTVYELADAARLSVPSCRAMLGELCRQGTLRRKGKVSRPVTVKRTTHLYAMQAGE